MKMLDNINSLLSSLRLGAVDFDSLFAAKTDLTPLGSI